MKRLESFGDSSLVVVVSLLGYRTKFQLSYLTEVVLWEAWSSPNLGSLFPSVHFFFPSPTTTSLEDGTLTFGGFLGSNTFSSK